MKDNEGVEQEEGNKGGNLTISKSERASVERSSTAIFWSADCFCGVVYTLCWSNLGKEKERREERR